MLENIKILICEDNRLTQRLLEMSLKKMNFDIHLATDGDEAIRILKEEDIGLVITDINMPYNSGLEVVEYIRRNFEKKIPIIIVTNIVLDETRILAEELGADSYITKPFDPIELTEAINALGF
jgi:DNA-binding response OmpR family regulator